MDYAAVAGVSKSSRIDDNDDEKLQQPKFSFSIPSSFEENNSDPSSFSYSPPLPTSSVDSSHHHKYEEESSSAAVKLFVGQVPRTMEEDGLRDIMEKYGEIESVVIIRDKVSSSHRGCAFVTYCTAEGATAAVENLHNKVTLPPASNPLQVRPAEGQTGSVVQEHKLFIGMIPKTADEVEIREIFGSYGDIEEVYILRQPGSGLSKGCAFLKYKDRDSALSAIEHVNGNVTMTGGASTLVVKLADSRRQRVQRNVVSHPKAEENYWQPPQPGGSSESSTGGAIPFAHMQAMQQQYLSQLHKAPLSLSSSSAPTSASTSIPSSSELYYNPYAPPHSGSSTTQYGRSYSSSSSSSAAAAGDSSGVVIPPIPVVPPSAVQPSMVDTSLPRSNSSTTSAGQVEGPPGANLFIYHLPHDLTDADLATAFAPFGNVISAKVYMDKNTGESKGFGFVSYDDVAAADIAIISMNGFQIGSKRLKVQHKRVHQSQVPSQLPFDPYHAPPPPHGYYQQHSYYQSPPPPPPPPQFAGGDDNSSLLEESMQSLSVSNLPPPPTVPPSSSNPNL